MVHVIILTFPVLVWEEDQLPEASAPSSGLFGERPLPEQLFFRIQLPLHDAK